MSEKSGHQFSANLFFSFFFFMIAQRLLWLIFMTYYSPDLFWLCTQTWLRKTRLISKFLTSQTKTEITTLHILHNISRSKGHQTRIFFQFIEYRMRNIFLEKWQKGGSKKTGVSRKQSPPIFPRKMNISYPLIRTYTCAY